MTATARGLTAVLAASSLAFTSFAASAAILNDEKNIAWASNRDLTSQQFAQRFDDYRARGFMMIDMDAYPTSSGVRYSMIWRENTDNRGWAEHRGLTSDQYNQRWEEYRARGWRPHDIETWVDGGNRRWAGIWVENRENLRWTSNRGLTHEAYGEMFDERRAAGFRLLDMEAYETGDGMRYSAIWIENRDSRPWAQLRNMTREGYQQEVDAKSASGFRVVDFEAYQTPNGLRFAAIWEKKDGFAWQTRTNRTETEFANMWRQYLDEGYRLVDFERYDTPQGPRYGGVWAENDDRFRNPLKGQIDTLVQNYRTANGFPGVSVAVIRDGDVIYRRGFGKADIDADMDAHGGTVYGLASVSKAIGGTLAAKLEAEGRLQDGTAVALNLRNATSSYLTNIPIGGGRRATIPSQHTHTVEQLLAHLGCVAHYPGNNGTIPGIADQTTHYSTAVAAVQTLWNTGLVTDRVPSTQVADACLVSGNVGQRRSYSTHAFTFVGAVLERVTGRAISRLVDEEIADQFGLGSMRTKYSTSALPSNRDRAALYTSATTETPHADNSWKVLGGGVESNAVDLARLGWGVLAGDIVDARTRDCRMWVQVGAGSTNGLGWNLGASAPGRRFADHAGDATGMDSYIRIYRDEGLVIAILANRNVQNSTRMALAASIETLLLGSTVAAAPAVNCAAPAPVILRRPLQPQLERRGPQRINPGDLN